MILFILRWFKLLHIYCQIVQMWWTFLDRRSYQNCRQSITILLVILIRNFENFRLAKWPRCQFNINFIFIFLSLVIIVDFNFIFTRTLYILLENFINFLLFVEKSDNFFRFIKFIWLNQWWRTFWNEVYQK